MYELLVLDSAWQHTAISRGPIFKKIFGQTEEKLRIRSDLGKS